MSARLYDFSLYVNEFKSKRINNHVLARWGSTMRGFMSMQNIELQY